MRAIAFRAAAAVAALSVAACAHHDDAPRGSSTPHHHGGHHGHDHGHHHEEAALQITPITPQPLSGDQAPWTSLEALDSEARFHFAVVSDNTGGWREGVWAHAMTRLNLVQPAFTVSVGDIIQGYTDDRGQILEEWEEMDGHIAELDAPFFYVPGNHDYSNQVMADIWAERYGPDHYAFTYKDTLFVVLNSALFDRSDTEGHGQRRGDWEAEQAAQMT